MTMPHLMNCQHSPDSWCLDCVKKLHDENEKENEYLKNLLNRLMSEVRPYCRPSLVDYDVFPVFKEAVEYLNE